MEKDQSFTQHKVQKGVQNIFANIAVCVNPECIMHKNCVQCRFRKWDGLRGEFERRHPFSNFIPQTRGARGICSEQFEVTCKDRRVVTHRGWKAFNEGLPVRLLYKFPGRVPETQPTGILKESEFVVVKHIELL